MATKLIAFAKINTGTGTWEEDFEVPSKEKAEEEIKEVIDYFNATLKPGEHPRSFEGIVRFEEKEIEVKEIPEYDVDDYDDDDDY